MALSLWLLFDQQLYLQSIGAETADYFVGTYIILGVGMVMTLVGKWRKTMMWYAIKNSINLNNLCNTMEIKWTFLSGFLGCCGAWKESTWMLGTVSVIFEQWEIKCWGYPVSCYSKSIISKETIYKQIPFFSSLFSS